MKQFTNSLIENKVLGFFLLWIGLCNTKGIFNGTYTAIEKYPSQVCINYIQPNGVPDQLCGGTIINSWHVLTSCHCFEKYVDIDHPTEYIVAGDSRWNTTNPSIFRQERSITNIIVHPGCKLIGSHHVDMAICKINESFIMTGTTLNTLPISQRKPVIGTECIFVGWGENEFGRKSTIVRSSIHKVYPLHKCGAHYTDDENFLCASSDFGYQSPCYGDCGGPLICNNELVGILEGGNGICGNKLYGNYFTRVGKYIEWIQDVSSWENFSIQLFKFYSSLITTFQALFIIYCV